MTKLKPDKPTCRETYALDRSRAILVELHPRHLVVRLKGVRSERYELSYDAVLDLGRRLALRKKLAEAQQEKLKLRKGVGR